MKFWNIVGYLKTTSWFSKYRCVPKIRFWISKISMYLKCASVICKLSLCTNYCGFIDILKFKTFAMFKFTLFYCGFIDSLKFKTFAVFKFAWICYEFICMLRFTTVAIIKFVLFYCCFIDSLRFKTFAIFKYGLVYYGFIDILILWWNRSWQTDIWTSHASAWPHCGKINFYCLNSAER